jgi:hypothetical protein
VWEAFEAERPSFVPYAGRFDGYHATPASVSKTCLVRFDNNKHVKRLAGVEVHDGRARNIVFTNTSTARRSGGTRAMTHSLLAIRMRRS